MTILITVDGEDRPFEFPDGTTDEEIKTALDNLFSVVTPPPPPEPVGETMGERALGVADAGLSMASRAANTLMGGLAGTVATPLFGAETGANVVNSFTNTIRPPQTPEGQQYLGEAGNSIQSIIDELNIPLASVGGFIEILKNQGVEKAIETYSRIRKDGAGVVAGDRVLEETGNPLYATVARVLPEALLEVAGAKGGAGAIRRGPTSLAPNSFNQAVQAGTNRVVRGSKSQQNLAKLIEADQPSSKTAGYMLEDPSPLRQSMGATKQVAVRDPRQVAAVNQGFDEGNIAVIVKSTPADRAGYRRQLDIQERAMTDAEFRLDNRPSDVTGDALRSRYKAVRTANRKAGKRLDVIVKEVEGRPVNSSDIFVKFADQLEEKLGVFINEDGSPNFKAAIIEGSSGSELAVKNILRRLKRSANPSFKELHDMKLYIDEQVTFGKTETGLTGRTERVLKDLRRDINTRLGKNFEPYRNANKDYSVTIEAIDNLQDVAGKKMNFDGPSADKALGTLLRRIMSNAQSRINLLDASMEMERVAGLYGPTFEDSIKRQVIFANELDSAFKTLPGTSFQAEIVKGIQTIPTDSVGLGMKVMEKVEGKIKGRSPDQALKAMRDLVNSNN